MARTVWITITVNCSMDMENLCGLNLPNSFHTVSQQSGIPYTVQYDPNTIVGSYPNAIVGSYPHNLVFPAAGVWQGNAWVQGWGSYPDTGQLNYAPESYSVSNDWQPSYFNGVNSSFSNDVLPADGAWTGTQRSPPGNCIYRIKNGNLALLLHVYSVSFIAC